MTEPFAFDHYQVLARDDGSAFELGRGAMGITYKAMDSNLRVPVALKVINGRFLESDVARQRFVREARSAAKLRHRHVASVFHLGIKDDAYFYAMEFVDGETVESLIRRTGPQPPLIALRIALQVTRALMAAAQHGLVHRDIKPSNLMLVREDDELCVKVIDFGLAKSLDSGPGEEGSAALSMGGFFGTPQFASPEQLMEQPIDARSDIYSLGMTLWYMLSGRAAFGGSMAVVMSQQLESPPPFETLPSLPAPIGELLKRMLAKKPEGRPATAAILRGEIEAAIAQIAGGPGAAAARAAIEEEQFDTILDGAPVRSAPSEFVPGGKVAERFTIVAALGESNLGEQFRARDKDESDLRLVVLRGEWTADPSLVSAIEREVQKVSAAVHPNLLGVKPLVFTGSVALLPLEWTTGFSVLELLRARRSLSSEEGLPLIRQLAEGVDFALSSGLPRLDLKLHETFLHFPGQAETDPGWLRLPMAQWPPSQAKINLLEITGALASVAEGASDQTIVGNVEPSSTGNEDPRALALRSLGRFTYELLGGSISPVPSPGSPMRYVPLASLGEAGNAALKTVFDTPSSFGSARELAAALGESSGYEAPPPPKPRTAPLPPVPAPLPPAVGTSAASPWTAPPPAPAGRAKPVLPLVAAALLALAAVGGVLWWFSPPAPLGTTPRLDSARTNLPVAGTPPLRLHESTPPPEGAPAAPTRAELLKQAVAQAEEVEAGGSEAAAISAWNKVAAGFPEDGVGAMRLETMIDALRSRPEKLSATDFATLREPVTGAARLGVIGAMMLLADNLRSSNAPEAFYWYSQAASRSYPPALTQAGFMLANGAGVEKSTAKAVEHFTKAADLGDATAEFALAECLLYGKGIAQDQARAVDLLREAVRQGNPRAMNCLGDLYHKGTGVKKDVAEAQRLFTEAAQAGDAAANGNLGVLYMNGEGGIPRNPPKAVELFQKGANQGDAFCMYLLARCFELGSGTVLDPAEAQRWYQKAAEAGHPGARQWCADHHVEFVSPRHPPV